MCFPGRIDSSPQAAALPSGDCLASEERPRAARYAPVTILSGVVLDRKMIMLNYFCKDNSAARSEAGPLP
jgi:hypothetical protein